MTHKYLEGLNIKIHEIYMLLMNKLNQLNWRHGIHPVSKHSVNDFTKNVVQALYSFKMDPAAFRENMEMLKTLWGSWVDKRISAVDKKNKYHCQILVNSNFNMPERCLFSMSLCIFI